MRTKADKGEGGDQFFYCIFCGHSLWMIPVHDEYVKLVSIKTASSSIEQYL